MENKPLVSVIIPVYNVEKYLRECLDSVVNQTLRDIEIICVDDGSTDGSLGILNEYAARDNRVSVIHQENRGQSAARNVGMKQACGEYVYFLDSDDYITPDALEVLYNTAIINDTDIIYFGAECFYETEDARKKAPEFQNYYRRKATDGVLSSEEMITVFQNSYSFKVIVQAQFFKRSCLLENKVSFFEGIIREDELYSAVALCKAHRCMVIEDMFCKRRIRPESTMTSSSAAKMFKGCFIVSIQLMREASLYDEPSDVRRLFLMERSEVLLDSAKEYYKLLDNSQRSKMLNDLPSECKPEFENFAQNCTKSSKTTSLSGSKISKIVRFFRRNGFMNTAKRFLNSCKEYGFTFTIKRLL